MYAFERYTALYILSFKPKRYMHTASVKKQVCMFAAWRFNWVSTITWTVTDACGNESTCTTTVTINPLPTPVITGPSPACVATETVVYSTPAVGCNTYSWTISAGGTIIGSSTGNSITVQWTTPGTKTVTVTETMCGTGCTATVSQTVIVNPKPVTTPITHN